MIDINGMSGVPLAIIRRMHRDLMKRMHSGYGGSTHLASNVKRR